MNSSKPSGIMVLVAGIIGAFFGLPLLVALIIGAASLSICQSASTVEMKDLAGQSAQDYLADFTDAEQAAKFAIIKEAAKAGAERNPPATTRAVVNTIATGIQETNLTIPEKDTKEKDSNDLDSAGYLQQRPSQGWGTEDQVRDPYYATNQFLDRYDKLPGAATMSMKEVALAIQRPSISAYARWNWDRTAAELYEMVIGQNGNTSCNESTEWQSPIPSYYANSDPYGVRHLDGEPNPRMHWGQDIAAPGGTPIHAAHAGVIDYIAPLGTFGNYVRIVHNDDIETGYAHMSRFEPGLKVGDHVNVGDVIGYVGTTGLSTGNHLHFEISVSGKKVDPVEFLKGVGVDMTKPSE